LSYQANWELVIHSSIGYSAAPVSQRSGFESRQA